MLKMAEVLHMMLSCFCLLFLLSCPCAGLPLCTDLRAPSVPKTHLGFCNYNGSVCCDSSKDVQLQGQFAAMNVSDNACASVMKSILCATCDQFSAELFRVKSGSRTVPLLCNSSTTAVSSLSSEVTDGSFCSNVWKICQNISISNSPFAPSLQNKAGPRQNSTPSKLNDLWQSEIEFCQTFGGAADEDHSICFDGAPIQLIKNETLAPPSGMCLEKIENGSYLNMVAHPDGSNRAFFSSQEGKIWLGTIPEQDSGEAMGLDESNPFVDLTDQVYYSARFGMMGMAFHPNFAQNGRFYASFSCDKSTTPGCAGRCACNTDVGCDPSNIVSPDSSQPCQYYSVVAEYSTNGTASTPSTADKATPFEVRRIFTLGLPYAANQGGEILFGPDDGYLYVTVGDGGSKGDPYNFAQNKKSLLGKILRIDVDNIPSEQEMSDLSLWGNYSIPRDNPHQEDKDMKPEIWALGLRNPWRCSFDSERPSYFVCADVGQDQYEEVDIISKGGNYGWRVYEGPIPFRPQQTPGGNTSAASISPIFPVVGYTHSEVNSNEGSAAICGGYFYRSKTDPCLYGSYIYADLYAKNIWAATENPTNSGNFTSINIPFRCARDSPIGCGTVPNTPLPALGYIYSFGQDNRKDVLILTSSGVYRVVRPSRCNYTCSQENVTVTESPSPPAPSSSQSIYPRKDHILFLSSLLLVLGFTL